MGIKPLVVAARYKFLLLVPFLVIVPAAVILSVLNMKTTYTSSATVFVNESAVLDNLVDGNPYASPAQNRANDLNELLQTRRFRFDVARRVDPSLQNEDDAAGLIYEIGKGISVYANGRRALVIAFTSPDASRPRVITQAVLDTFKSEFTGSIAQKAQIIKETQQAQQAEDKQARDDLDKKMQEYIAQYRGTNITTDAQYQSYQQQLDRLDASIRAADTAIRNADASLNAARQNQDDYFLSTQDPPLDPSGKDPISKKNLIALPLAGMLVALSLSAALYAFLFRTDNRIRTVEDLKALPGVLVLGTVPDASPVRKRSWPRNFFRIAVAGLGVTGQR
jgi:capsular polysaccharide biosynthesis protein